MSIPHSLYDLGKMFEWEHDRRAENKQAVCEWLDAAYTDFEDLSKQWFRIRESIETANERQEIITAVEIIRRGPESQVQYQLIRMRELAKAIQQDVVSLQVLIKTFKAQR